MTIEYLTITYNPTNIKRLSEAGKKGWRLVTIYEWHMFFSRDKKQTREQKKLEQTKEYLEFREKYKKLSSNWIYDTKLINKYNKLVSEWLHNTILNCIDWYEKECNLLNRPFLNPYTFLNRQTWLQEFKIVKNKEELWINDMLKDLPEQTIKDVTKTYKEWEKTMHKDITEWVLKNIIDKFNN